VLTPLFAARRVALVGASDDPARAGGILWRNLRSFPGEVVPVARTATVDGRPAYPRLVDVPAAVDLVVVAVPAAATVEVLRDAGAAGVAVAVVVSGGFAETGPAGRRLQEQLLAAGRAGGVRLVGPNCLGVQDCDRPLNASLAAELPPGGGGVSLLSQSGAYGMAMHALAADEGMRFAKLVSTGNKADVADAELLALLRVDPATRVVGVLAESLPDGRRFVEELQRTTPVKPVLVAGTGRSPAGARAALSHTAALAGDAAVREAALSAAGAVLTRTGLELLDAARCLAVTTAPRGPRVGIVTNSGGTAVELADLLDDLGLTVPELSAAAQDRLRGHLPAFGSPRNPVDLTPAWARYPELYPLAVAELARSGEVDVVLAVLVHRAALSEPTARALAGTAERLRAEGVRVPLLACTLAPSDALPNARRLTAAGVPCFPWPERAARAAAHAVRARAGAAPARPPVGLPAGPPEGPPAGPPAGLLDPDAAAGRLRAAGVPLVPYVLAGSAAAAAAAAAGQPPPYVVKLVAAGVVHKSDVGGVRLGLPDPAEVARAAGALLAGRAGARVLVSPQLSGLELMVGGLRDPAFGPAVLVGAGGGLVELVRDVAWVLAPLTVEQAERTLRRLRCAALLDGYRGRPAVDVGALARLMCAVGELLVARPEVTEVDLNPVLALPAGCTAVDWRVVTVGADTPAGPAGPAALPVPAGSPAGG
jgi:acyl-CoA synthetase (NDP forming)